MAEGHRFGGDWTEEKLDRVDSYLRTYTTLMKRQPFCLTYIDAFAGSGSRVEDLAPEEDLFAEEERKAFRDGSARRALKLLEPFDQYLFVERNRTRYQELEQLHSEFPALSSRITLINADCNAFLQGLCTQKWFDRRAVLFLDPYGLQVSWQTMVSVSQTEAIDAWILIPVAAINRLLVRHEEIPASWKLKLDRLFGTRGWHERFYRESTQGYLFDFEQDRRKIATLEAIERYYVERLQSVFPRVAKRLLRLHNRKNVQIFSLCFACANPSRKAHDLAIRIAEFILGK